MTSLLTSIFGKNDNEYNESTELFANSIVAPQLTTFARPTTDHQPPAQKRSQKDQPAFDPHAQDDRTVFVGNLPANTTRKDLVRAFKACGPIASTRIRSVATQADAAVKLPPQQAGNQKLVRQILVNQRKVDTTVKATVQGYVVFQSADAVEHALQLNNTPISIANEKEETTRHMRVDRVNKEYDAKRSVFVGNLPYQADEETLRETFLQGCPDWNDDDVEGVRLVRDKATHQCKGFGYLLFKDASFVSTALRTMDGQDYHGRPLRVRVCGKRFKSKPDDDTKNSKKAAQPVAVSLRKMVTEDQKQHQLLQSNKRKRGTKKARATSTGKSKRAAAEAKTNQRIKKIEKRIRKGMGKMKK